MQELEIDEKQERLMIRNQKLTAQLLDTFDAKQYVLYTKQQEVQKKLNKMYCKDLIATILKAQNKKEVK